MHVIYLVLYIAALVLFLMDTFGVVITRINPVALGLACIATALILKTLQTI